MDRFLSNTLGVNGYDGKIPDDVERIMNLGTVDRETKPPWEYDPESDEWWSED
jgi:hypothetical protein